MKTNTGFSLVELLVSMLIAGIIFSGVLSVVQVSNRNFETEQESSFIQENARYALEILNRDIRLAGSFGCAGVQTASLVNVVENVQDDLFSSEAVVGYEGGGVASVTGWPVAWLNTVEATPGTDAVVLRYADPASSININRHINATSATIDADHNFEQGDQLIIVDASCRHIGIFENTSNSNSQLSHSTGGGGGGGGGNGNCSHVLRADRDLSCASPNCRTTSCDGEAPQAYGDGSSVMTFVANGYFIADSDILPGTPALKRRVLVSSGARSEELAQGVEDMQLLFGISDATVEPGTVIQYLEADEIVDWNTVIAVRIQLMLRSQTEVLDENVGIRDLDDFNTVLTGAAVAEPDCVADPDECDRFLRQVVTSTVRIRNRS